MHSASWQYNCMFSPNLNGEAETVVKVKTDNSFEESKVHLTT